MDEIHWIQRVKAGDHSAWEPLVKVHQEAAYRLAYLLLGDAGDAEEVAQESFLRAFHSLDHFDTTRPLRPWLLSITANLARNRKRANGRYMAALHRLFSKDQPGNQYSLDRAIEEQSFKNLDAQTLWQAVQKLDETGKQLVYLHFFLECSMEETAEVMGKPIGTAKSRLHRTLVKLRALLEKEFHVLPEGREE